MTVQDHDIDTGVQEARARLHRRMLPTATAFSAGVALVLVAVLWPAAPRGTLVLWFGLLTLAILLRLAVGRAQDHDARAPERAALWLRRHRVAFTLHGAVWAGAVLSFASTLPSAQFEPVLLAVGTVTAGALILLAFDGLATLMFVSLTLPVLAWGALGSDAVSRTGLAATLLLLLSFTGLNVRRSHRSLHRSVQLRLNEAQRLREAELSGQRADQAHLQLADQHHLLRQLMQTTHQGFWFLDPQGITTDLNPAMAALLGRTREDVLGRSVLDFFEGEDLDTLRAEIERRHQGLPGSYEIGLQRPDGTRLHCVNQATPLYDTRGGRVGTVGLFTDITVRREAEAQLRTYELAVNSITDLVSVTDQHAVYRMVNDAWCRASGVPRAQALGRRSGDALPGSVLPERRQALREAIASGEPRSARGPGVGPGLEGRLLETTYYPHAGNQGDERFVAIVTRDITEQDGALRRLRANDAEQRALLDAFPGFIGGIDAELVYTYVNQRLAALMGRTPEQMVGHSAVEVLGPERAAALRPLVQQALAGDTLSYETRHRHPGDGREVDVRVSFARGVQPVDGRAVVFGFGVDISAHLQAERALRTSEAELRGLLAAFPGYIAAVDDSLEYTYINERMAAVWGQPAAAVVGRPVAEVVGSTHATAIEAELARARAGIDAVSIRRYSGSHGAPPVVLEITHVAGPAQPDGRRTGYAFGIDITARQRAEEALIAARDEAERANRAKSQFLAQMSHELRTPLNAILGFGQLLETDTLQPLCGRQQAQVREILRGARHLLALINEILDLGRIEAGKLQLDTEPVPVAPLLDECVALTQPLAQEHAVQLQLPAATTGLAVRADRTRLKQVLLNLLGNAIKYNRHGGLVSVHAEADGGRVRITVHDTGRGLDATEQARLFQPFERLGAAHSGIEGTGIGLALSRRLVESMGGEVGVHSEPGVGSRFWVLLPEPKALPTHEDPDRQRAAPPSPPVHPAPAPLAGPPEPVHTVLYIEDNAVNVVLMEAMLHQLPEVRLLSALLPQTGLELAERERPALVLLDIQLPGMDGFEVLKRLRVMPALRHTPVVAVSANAVPADIDAALAAGFTAYLTKPLELQGLLSTVRRLLAQPQPGAGAPTPGSVQAT